MASLIEELISILEEENYIYEKLLPIARMKTRVIVENDVSTLQQITYKEQDVVDQIANLEKKRQKIVENIATVINQDPKGLTVKEVIVLLEKQPSEQKKLTMIHDKLKKTVDLLIETNKHNKVLIEQSLEMVEFNLNLVQNAKLSPLTGNYNKGAYSSNTALPFSGMFDTKR